MVPGRIACLGRSRRVHAQLVALSTSPGFAAPRHGRTRRHSGGRRRYGPPRAEPWPHPGLQYLRGRLRGRRCWHRALPRAAGGDAATGGFRPGVSATAGGFAPMARTTGPAGFGTNGTPPRAFAAAAGGLGRATAGAARFRAGGGGFAPLTIRHGRAPFRRTLRGRGRRRLASAQTPATGAPVAAATGNGTVSTA